VVTDSYSQAEYWLASGHFDQAAEAAERRIAVDSEDGRAWEIRGLAAAWRREPQLARQSLETAMSLVPLRPAAAIALADLYHDIDRQLAQRLYLQAVMHPRVDSSLKLVAASGLDRLDWPHLSIRICRQVIQQDADSAQACFDLSYYLGRTGAPDKMVESLARRAIELAPDRCQFRIGLAGFLAQRKRPQDAFALVRHLSSSELEMVTCQCCLHRLQLVFEAVDDAERAAWCRSRLARVAVNDASTGKGE